MEPGRDNGMLCPATLSDRKIYMAYSNSEVTLERMMPELQLLASGQECVWRLEPGSDPHKLAYKIREALYIASLYPDKYPALADAQDRFKIRVMNNREVRAMFARRPASSEMERIPQKSATPMVEDVAIHNRMAMPQTAATIIQTWVDTQPSNERYYFPKAEMEPTELVALHRWATEHGWIFFVDERTTALTLQRTERDIEAFAWSPSDLEEQ